MKCPWLIYIEPIRHLIFTFYITFPAKRYLSSAPAAADRYYNELSFQKKAPTHRSASELHLSV